LPINHTIMKTLYLVRHAKSSWETAGLADDQRPLLPRGIKKTKLIVDYLVKRKTLVDLIISSHAVRAIGTAEILAKGLNYPIDQVRIERRIYEGLYDRILEVIYAIGDEMDSIMIVGHNPTITSIANLFLHPGIGDMPTSTVVCLSFETGKWENIPSVPAKKEFVVFPKMLN
jgi:phosphohistidine phosphatase